jgi:7,8-dihydropterin-6-yl-methyl-4-(beta-D-ribofuranosyl)aminobenzene 5'-phosphate synthase
MQKLKITVLSENVAGKWCRAEHGLSFLVEADRKILFDTGSSDLIRYNAQRLGINLSEIDTLVLSHGHNDHSGGLMLWDGQQLICHPETFIKRFRKSNSTPLGIQWSEAEIRSKFVVQTSSDAVKLSEQMYFLGEIPRITKFESQTTAFKKADGTDDFVLDDSGLAIITNNGLVVISGCAHSGICNMVLHAQKVTGIEKVHAVVGGFHLQNDDETTRITIDWLKSAKVEQVIPSHCTGFVAQAAIFKTFKFIQTKTGNVIELG